MKRCKDCNLYGKKQGKKYWKCLKEFMRQKPMNPEDCEDWYSRKWWKFWRPK